MSRKKDAKKRKAVILRNKKLIKRYPWIRPVGWYFERIKTFSFTMYDDVPIGWKRAFGRIMLEEYRKVLISHNYLNKFQWVQVKEKYGTLRLYSNAAPKEVLDLETKYDYISRYVCISCGRINVPLLTSGWVEPLCEDCYNKNIATQRQYHEEYNKSQEFRYIPYKNLKKVNQEIEMIVRYKCYSPDKRECVRTCDYSDTINVIMERQKKLFP